MLGSKLICDVIKDVSTVKNGEDYCIAGITGIVGLIIGCIVMIVATAVIFHGMTEMDKLVEELGNLLVKFGAYLGTLISTVCAGKAVKNNAEPQ